MPRVKKFDESIILEKAMNLFWEKGYYATSIQDLVENLGVNRASLYATYGGKKSLYLQSFTHYRRINIQAIQAFFKSHPNVKEGFKILFTNVIKESANAKEFKGCFVVNSTIELIPNELEFFELIEQNRVEFEKLFYNYLNTGLDQNQIPINKDLHAIAAAIFTYYNGLRVLTKLEFDESAMIQSMHAFLSILD